jgi:hypothetical protein
VPRVLVGAILLSQLGCQPPASSGVQPEKVPARPQRAATSRGAAAAPARDSGQPIVLVTDRAALEVVSVRGGSFETMLAARWPAVAGVLEEEVRRVAAGDKQAGVGVRGHPHRLFDARWLRAKTARFELVAVVNRIDRSPLTPGECGELRLIYRLAYRVGDSASRLPMTVNLALRGERAESGCAAAAARWMVYRRGAAGSLTGAALGEWLASSGGPLGGALEPGRLTRVEVNLQLVRWPSAVRPDLGGHAEYLLRVFRPSAGGQAELTPAPLLNVPEVAHLSRRQRAALRAWIRDPDNLARIDSGGAQLPEALSATRMISVSPRGLVRRANRPYRQLFKAADFADLDLKRYRRIASAEALLRRLDDMTCAGCHQGRTIAGFHLLGEDGAEEVAGNALAVPFSAHLVAEIERRATLTRALAAGGQPDLARPFAERDDADSGGYGSHCGLGDAGFAAWECAEGLRCQRYDAPDDDAVVGVCLPALAEVGDPCQVGPVEPHPDPHRDRIRRSPETACGGAQRCNLNQTGFPGGMCTASCESKEAHVACGVIAQLTPFNNCLAAKRRFAECIAEHVSPAGLRACDAEHPCRDDYICARTPSGPGACIPPYFLFQLRVDGHP